VTVHVKLLFNKIVTVYMSPFYWYFVLLYGRQVENAFSCDGYVVTQLLSLHLSGRSKENDINLLWWLLLGTRVETWSSRTQRSATISRVVRWNHILCNPIIAAPRSSETFGVTHSKHDVKTHMTTTQTVLGLHLQPSAYIPNSYLRKTPLAPDLPKCNYCACLGVCAHMWLLYGIRLKEIFPPRKEITL
jgi:hypothetical protein